MRRFGPYARVRTFWNVPALSSVRTGRNPVGVAAFPAILDVPLSSTSARCTGTQNSGRCTVSYMRTNDQIVGRYRTLTNVSVGNFWFQLNCEQNLLNSKVQPCTFVGKRKVDRAFVHDVCARHFISSREPCSDTGRAVDLQNKISIMFFRLRSC